MRIKILKDTVAGKKSVKAGSIIEVSDSDARILVSQKMAVKVSDDETSDESESKKKK